VPLGLLTEEQLIERRLSLKSEMRRRSSSSGKTLRIKDSKLLKYKKKGMVKKKEALAAAGKAAMTKSIKKLRRLVKLADKNARRRERIQAERKMARGAPTMNAIEEEESKQEEGSAGMAVEMYDSLRFSDQQIKDLNVFLGVDEKTQRMGRVETKKKALKIN